jgi:hypothetical protein
MAQKRKTLGKWRAEIKPNIYINIVNILKVLRGVEIESSGAGAGVPNAGRPSANGRKHPRFHVATNVTEN